MAKIPPVTGRRLARNLHPQPRGRHARAVGTYAIPDGVRPRRRVGCRVGRRDAAEIHVGVATAEERAAPTPLSLRAEHGKVDDRLARRRTNPRQELTAILRRNRAALGEAPKATPAAMLTAASDGARCPIRRITRAHVERIRRRRRAPAAQRRQHPHRPANPSLRNAERELLLRSCPRLPDSAAETPPEKSSSSTGTSGCSPGFA